MLWVLVSCVVVIGLWFSSEFIGRVWAEIHEYETMKARGYKLFKDDNGRYWWMD